MKHTALPWKIDKTDSGYHILSDKWLIADLWQAPNASHEKANAKLIVKAVNCHEELVEACKPAITELDKILSWLTMEPEVRESITVVVNKLEQTLAKATS